MPSAYICYDELEKIGYVISEMVRNLLFLLSLKNRLKISGLKIISQFVYSLIWKVLYMRCSLAFRKIIT